MFLHNYNPTPIFFTGGGFTVYWYGLVLVASIIIGYFLTRVWWQEQGKKITDLENLCFWLVVVGLVGARLFDVFIFEWWYFKNHLADIYKLWQGGLSFQGAIISGALVVWYWCWRRKLSFINTLATFAPALAMAQAVGRWGNYFNQELFGLPTNLPWGIPISVFNRPLEFLNNEYFHPVFLYESLGLLALGAWLWWRRQRLSASVMLGGYLVLANSIRLGLEFLRVDAQDIFWELRAGVVVSLILILIGLLILVSSQFNRSSNI